MLHKTCGSRLKQQYICIKEEVLVPREDIVKGYEFAKDQYVMFTPEELKAMEEAGTHMAEITEFVPLEAVDPVYFDKAYYLAPDKGGAKPYALLAAALRESNRCALGRWAARGKQYIVMIRPVDDGLVMQQLLYAGEVRAMKDLEIPKTEVKPAELKLAQQLIEQQTSDTFDPSQYTDDVAARIEAAVQKKVEGQEITLAEAPEGGGAQVIDLMEALRASLEKKAPAREAAAEPAAAEPAPATRKPAKRAQQAAAAGAGRAQGGEEISDIGGAREAVHAYGVRDVEKLLRLSRSTIRSLIAAGFVTPARGPRGAWRFSFQDLIVLRTAQALAEANVPPRRIMRSMRELRRHLPDAMPLSGLDIGAVADRVVVREGGSRWQAESGQYLLEFDGDPGRRLVERDRARDAGEAARGAEAWFDRGRGAGARTTPMRRWRPTSSDRRRSARSSTRYINLGRLLHDGQAPRQGRARLPRGDRGLRQRSRAALQPRRAARRHGARGPRRSTRTRRRCAPIPAWPIVTTTWRCSTRSSASRRTRSGTWRGIAC